MAHNETEIHLIKLSRQLMYAIINNDPSDPDLQRLVAPDFRATDQHSENESMDITEFLDLIKRLQTSYYTQTRTEIMEETVDIDTSCNEPIATVWRRVQGHRENVGLVTEGMRMTKWRKDSTQEGDWVCYYCVVALSSPLVSGNMGDA